MGCFILSAASFWFSRSPFHWFTSSYSCRPSRHCPVPCQLFLVLPLLYVAFWCFKRSVQCDRAFIFKCAFTGFDAYQSNSLERLGEGEMGTSSPKGLLNNPSYALFSYLCQDCGLNNKSSLPQILQATCQFCCPDTWQTIDLQWSDTYQIWNGLTLDVAVHVAFLSLFCIIRVR